MSVKLPTGASVARIRRVPGCTVSVERRALRVRAVVAPGALDVPEQAEERRGCPLLGWVGGAHACGEVSPDEARGARVDHQPRMLASQDAGVDVDTRLGQAI